MAKKDTQEVGENFSQDTKNTILLWCDRHCCLCKKNCGLDIEIHHIKPKSKGGKGNIENGIALCFDCHAKVHYKGFRGNSIKQEEMIIRRDQIYDEFTSHLVPPVSLLITQNPNRRLPDVGFEIYNLGTTYPIQAKIRIASVFGNNEEFLTSKESSHYSGSYTWKLNPQKGFHGHFRLPDRLFPPNGGSLELRVHIEIIDIHGRSHNRLPEGFKYMSEINDWYAEP